MKKKFKLALPIVTILSIIITGVPAKVQILTPAGNGGYLLPNGFFHTQSNQILDSADIPLRIASIAWHGTEGPSGSALHGLWSQSYQTILESLKAAGFNTVRIPWSDTNLNAVPAKTVALGTIDFIKNPDLEDQTTLQIFKTIVDYASQIGLKIIFDHHTNDGCCGQQPNGLWIDLGPGTDGTDGGGNPGSVNFATFMHNWVTIARTFSGNSTVIGFDLHNEPTSAGNINWGQGGPTDILAMFTTVGNAIQSVNPDVLIICEGPQEYHAPSSGYGMAPGVIAPEGDLTGVRELPVVLKIKNKVVYSVHEYPNEISNIDSVSSDRGLVAIQRMNAAWGFLVTQNIAPVWVGEMGSSMDSSDSKAWAHTLINYMNGHYSDMGGPSFDRRISQPIGGGWWRAGSEIDRPNGIQTQWGLGNYRQEQKMAYIQILFTPTVLAYDR